MQLKIIEMMEIVYLDYFMIPLKVETIELERQMFID